MSKASKRVRAATAPTGGRVAPAPVAPGPRRVNYRALIILGAVVLAAVPGFFALKAFQDYRGRNNLLVQARKASEAGQDEQALSFVRGYLQGRPGDLDALELQGKVLAKVARTGPILAEAIDVQRKILAFDPARAEAWKSLVELNLRSGSYRAAEAAAREYLARKPDDPEAHRLLGLSLELIGRNGDDQALAEAIAEYRKAHAARPGDIMGGIHLAGLLRDKRNDTAGAIRVLDTVVEKNPGSVPALLARSSFLAGLPGKDFADRAKADLQAAIDLDPAGLDARIVAAEQAARRNQPAEARRHLAAIQPPPKDDLRIKLITGMIELTEQRPDDAVQSWRSALIQTGGTDADLSWRTARVLLGLGRIADARPLMEQYHRLAGGTKENPRPEYRFLEALASLRQGVPQDAIRKLEETRDKIGRELAAQHMMMLGSAYASIRNESKAVECYRRAMTMPNAGAQPWLAIAKVQLDSQPDEAIATLEQGLFAAPEDPALLAAIAQVLYRRESAKPRDARDWAEFNRWLARADAAAPGSTEVAVLRADFLASSGQIEEALGVLEQVGARSPNSAGIWAARALALSRLGRTKEALAVLDAATKAVGETANFRVARARLYLDRGEPGRAYEALQKGIDAVPADQRHEIYRGLGEYYQGRSDPANARLAFEQWGRLQPESIDARLALFNLAMATNDAPAMAAQVAAMKSIGGASGLFWKVAKAESLLAAKPKDPRSRDPDDRARLAEAEGLIAEVIRDAEKQPSGYLLEARLALLRDQPDAAIVAYNKAVERRAGQVALGPLVRLLVEQKRLGELDELRRRVAKFPAEVDRMAGAVLLQRGDAEEAERMATRAAQGDPASLDAAVWKARILNTLGKPKEAEEALHLLTIQRPEDPSPWIQLLMLQVAHGDMAAASGTVETMKAKVRSDRPELLWASCYRVLGRQDEADEAFRAALAKWPDDERVLQAAIDYEETTGRPDPAEAHLRRLIALRPEYDWARRRLALNLSARPQDPAAHVEAMRLVDDLPKGAESPDDRMLRAVVLSRSDDPRRKAEAIAILEGLSSEVPNPGKMHEILAQSLAATDPKRAREHAAAAAAPDDARPDAILLYASILLRDDDLAEAQKQLDRLVRLDPKALPTVELQVRMLHARKDDAKAGEAALQAYRDRKKGPSALADGRGLIQVLISLGLLGPAETLAREVAQLGPKGKLILAEYLAGRGGEEEARALVEDAAKGGALADAVRSSLGIAGEPGASAAWIDQTDGLLRLALKGQPDSLQLLSSRAYLLHLQGKFEEEIKTYGEILAKKQGGEVFLNNWAWTLSEDMNRPAEGLVKADEVIARVGRQGHVLDTRGCILLRLNRTDEAIKDLEAAAASLGPGPVLYHLARAYHQAGRRDDFEATRKRAVDSGLKLERLQATERAEAARLLGLTAAAPPRQAANP